MEFVNRKSNKRHRKRRGYGIHDKANTNDE